MIVAYAIGRLRDRHTTAQVADYSVEKRQARCRRCEDQEVLVSEGDWNSQSSECTAA